MADFEGKYGINEDKKIKDFHRKRRMFCIKDGKVIIAKPNLPYSHAVWFEKEGWITEEDDILMDEMTRGVLTPDGDVYFYTGYNFELNKEIEKEFFQHLPELVKKLKLKKQAKVYGGLVEDDYTKKWAPKKDYGTVREFLS
jgi:hypothetical protein